MLLVTVAICYSESLYILQLTVLQFGIADRSIYCRSEWQFSIANRFIFCSLLFAILYRLPLYILQFRVVI
jgi:hypothetical protein